MVMEASPSPQSVGREFVRQYYTLLNKAPAHLHRFYNNNSSFVHGGLDAPNRETQPVIGQKQIHNRIQQLNFRDCHAKISQVDSQATLGNGVVVQVSGELSNGGAPMRRFTQTFVLAAQSPKKYYVHNDIFRYQDEVCGEEEGEPECGGSEHEEEAYQSPSVVQPAASGPAPVPFPPAPLPPPQRAFDLAHLAHLNGHDEPQLHTLSGSMGICEDNEAGEEDEEGCTAGEAAVPCELQPSTRTPTPPHHGTATTATALEEPPQPTEPKTYANLLKSSGLVAQRTAPTATVTTTTIVAAIGAEPPRAPPPRAYNPPPPPSGESGTRRYSDTQQLFLGNLPHAVNEDELRVLFEQFGAIAELKIHGKQNYGFITYEEPVAATRCLQADLRFPDTVDGCRINVEKKARGGARGGGGGGARGGGGGAGRAAAAPHRPAFPSRAPPAYRR